MQDVGGHHQDVGNDTNNKKTVNYVIIICGFLHGIISKLILNTISAKVKNNKPNLAKLK
jgi:hypothetical protein